MKVGEYIAKYVTKIDLFGEPVSLRLNQDTAVKTFVGGVLTVSVGIALFTIFWVFVMDVLNKVNPAISIESQFMKNRPEIVLNKTNMAIAFGMTDAATGGADWEKYFTFSLLLAHNENTADGEFTTQELEFGICDNTDFPYLSEEEFSQIGLEAMYCPKNMNVTIMGFWDEKVIQYLSIMVLKCNNTEVPTCASEEEIETFLSESAAYFNIYFSNKALVPQNFLNHTTNYTVNRYKGIRGDTSKIVEMFIRKQQVESDEGFVFSDDIKHHDSIALDYMEPDDTDMAANVLVEFQLISSNQFVIHHRVYKKISEVLADVGGLSSVFLFGSNLICYMFTNISRDEQILNKLFDFDFTLPEDDDKWERRKARAKKVDQIFDSPVTQRKRNTEKNLEVLSKFDKSSGKISKENSISEMKLDNIKDSKIFSLDSARTKSTNLLNMMEMKVRSKNSINENTENEQETQAKNQKTPDNINNFLPLADDNYSVNALNFNSNLDKVSENNQKDQPMKLETIAEVEVVPVSPSRSKRSTTLLKRPTLIQRTQTESYGDIIKRVLMLKNSNYQLKFSFWEVLRLLFCSCMLRNPLRHKYMLYKMSEFYLDEYLDIGNIVKTLEDVEKLKLILLNKQQIALFNFIAKNVVSLNTEKTKSSLINELKLFTRDEENLAKIIVDFIENLNNEKKDLDASSINEIDQKLFELIHDEFKENLIKLD